MANDAMGDSIINSCRYKWVSPKFLQISQMCVVFFVIRLYSYLAVHWIPQAELNDALHNAGTNNKIHSHFGKLWRNFGKLCCWPCNSITDINNALQVYSMTAPYGQNWRTFTNKQTVQWTIKLSLSKAIPFTLRPYGKWSNCCFNWNFYVSADQWLKLARWY